MSTDLYTYRRRATDLAIGGGVIAALHGLASKYDMHGRKPRGEGTFKPYMYKAWHGGKEIGYKKVEYPKTTLSSKKFSMAPAAKRRAYTMENRGRTRTRSVSVRAPVRSVSNRATPSRSMSMSRSWTPLNRYAQSRSRSIVSVRRARSANRRRRIAYNASRSAGFISGLRNRQTKLDKMSVNGVVAVNEEGGTQAATQPIPGLYQQALYIGHATCATNQMRKYFWHAFVKKMFNYQNIIIENWNNPAYPDITTPGHSVIWTIRYKDAPNGAVLSQNFTFDNTTAFSTIATQLDVFFNGTGQVYWFIDCKIRYGLGTQNTVGIFDLQNAHMEYHCKSALKIQNVTKSSETDDQTDDIEAVPLYGKSYEGSGSGAFFRQQEDNVAFQPNTNTGLIQISFDPFLNESLQEPPPQGHFKYVQRSGKVHMDSGQLKTSVLTYTKKLSFSSFYNKLLMGRPNTYNWTTLGKFRFFGLEKMITHKGTTADTVIAVIYELDQKMGMLMTCKKKNLSTYIVENSPV